MDEITRLKEISRTLRIDTLKSIYKAKSGHIGGAFSATEMIAVLYFHTLNIRPDEPSWPDRDRFVLSKGHSAPVLYAALARRGFFPVADLDRLRMADSHLQGAPNTKTPGIDMSSGPLGQGLSASVGMAMAARIDKKDYKVWCMIGDGEMQEGQIWEAAMTAGKYKLRNLVCILDHNGCQMSGTNEELMPLGDPGNKFKAFGFRIVRIPDANDIESVIETFDNLWDTDDDRPIAIIAETVKGKGVSFMEGLPKWHGLVPSDDEYSQALKELEEDAV